LRPLNLAVYDTLDLSKIRDNHNQGSQPVCKGEWLRSSSSQSPLDDYEIKDDLPRELQYGVGELRALARTNILFTYFKICSSFWKSSS
jgi:hypothetical protein